MTSSPSGSTQASGLSGSTAASGLSGSTRTTGLTVDDGRPDPSSTSVGALISEVTNDLSTLMRQELELAKAELKQEASKTGKAAGMLGAAGFAGYMVALFLSIALWWALANGMDEGWAALIVAAIWAVVGAVLFAVGRKRMRDVNPKPERTVQTLKEVPDALKGR
jgi:Putative Actinobacterial Holin-X, holin superfamily III